MIKCWWQIGVLFFNCTFSIMGGIFTFFCIIFILPIPNLKWRLLIGSFAQSHLVKKTLLILVWTKILTPESVIGASFVADDDQSILPASPYQDKSVLRVWFVQNTILWMLYLSFLTANSLTLSSGVFCSYLHNWIRPDFHNLRSDFRIFHLRLSVFAGLILSECILHVVTDRSFPLCWGVPILGLSSSYIPCAPFFICLQPYLQRHTNKTSSTLIIFLSMKQYLGLIVV